MHRATRRYVPLLLLTLVACTTDDARRSFDGAWRGVAVGCGAPEREWRMDVRDGTARAIILGVTHRAALDPDGAIVSASQGTTLRGRFQGSGFTGEFQPGPGCTYALTSHRAAPPVLPPLGPLP